MRRMTFLLILLLACGCLNYVLPSLEMTPPLNVGDAPGEVHVFRVDTLSKSGMINEDEYSLCEIPHSGPRISPQLKSGVDKGVVGPFLLYREHYHAGVTVRLYRAGYKTVSITDWSTKIVWEPATSVEEREKAIDDLIESPSPTAVSSVDDKGEWKVPQGLRPVGFSTEHAAALRFIGQQYKDLANSKLAEEALIDPNRILDKAEALRKHRAINRPVKK